MKQPVVAELRELLEDDFSIDPGMREDHGRDASYHPAAAPEAVAFPRTTDQVQSIVRIGSRHRIPMIPYGAGTSVEGQITAPRGGLCIDLARMDRIL